MTESTAPAPATNSGDPDDAPRPDGAAVGPEQDERSLWHRRRPRQTKHWYRLAFFFTVVLVVSVMVALPLAIRSMVGTLFASTEDIYYDLETGQTVSGESIGVGEDDRTYMNIALADLDLDSLGISMVASGHRLCTEDCPELDLLLLAVDDSPSRRGMAPSASIQMPGRSTAFTSTVELPIVGNPSLYPFDDYSLKLAISGVSVNDAGTPTPLTRENFADKLAIGVQDQITEMEMQPPVPFPLPEVVDDEHLYEAIAGQELVLSRPVYLRVLTVLLVLLIGISGVLALLTRSIDDLLLGIGGLILGVWGIRSVMVPQPLPTLSVVDVSLSGVILLLLIGLAVRAAIHFHSLSELRLLERLRSRK